VKGDTFGHTNRRSIVEMFRPPSGYRLDAAIGTTYSADFLTLTSIMLAFVDAETEDDEKLDIPKQLFAVTRLAKKMLLFVNRSNILYSGTRKSSRIYSIYDRIIREVSFEKGSFHPKVWLLKYKPRSTPSNIDRKPVYRIVCSSRNVTANNSWELAAQLDGRKEADKQPRGSVGVSLSDYFQQIQSKAGNEATVFEELISELPFIKFELPDGVDKCSFDFQWPGGGPLLRAIPSEGKRALIIAPFLSSTFLDEVCRRFKKVTLVSTRRELDQKLNEGLIKRISPDIYCVNDDLSAEVNTRLSLHAKLYMFDVENQQMMMLGSANASHSAWRGANCEAMLSFSPSMPEQKFMEQFVIKDAKTRETYPWIERYEMEDWERREEESDDEKIDATIDAAQKTLSQFEFELNYSESENRLLLRALQPQQKADIAAHGQEGLEFHVILISLIEPDADNQWSRFEISQAFSGGIHYEASVSKLTEFVCFRISHNPTKRSKHIVLKATQHNFADFLDTRDRELLRSELSASQFAQFLSAVLFDDNHRARNAVESLMKSKKPKGTRTADRMFGIFIEDVMLSCTEDASRISEVSGIMETFDGVDAEGHTYIDGDFRAFWAEFRLAFDSARKG